MNGKVGQVAFKLPKSGELYADKPYSDNTAQIIDEEARKMIDDAYQATLALIREKKEEVTKVNIVIRLPLSKFLHKRIVFVETLSSL